MTSWVAPLALAWPALLFTVAGLYLRRASLDPQTPRGDAVVVDLALGLVAVVASVLWLLVFILIAF